MVLCSSCHHLFNEEEIKLYDELPFCKEHYSKITQNDLNTICTIKLTPENISYGIMLADFQKILAEKKKVSFLKSFYKLEEDTILTTMSLSILRNDYDDIKKALLKQGLSKFILESN